MTVFCITYYTKGKKDYKMHNLLNALQMEFSRIEKDIENELLELDDFKLRILTSIKKLPAKTSIFDVIESLRNMTITKQPQNGVNILQLQFSKDTDPVIREIIANASFNSVGISQRDLLDFNVLTPESKCIDRGQCSLKNLPETCNCVLSKNPGCYIRINGDLDLRKFIDKKSKFDDYCLRNIVVNDDFYCSKYSKNFPFVVGGTFDCSGLGKDYITKDTILPITEKINCAYSITDFDVLMDILPTNDTDDDEDEKDELDTTTVKTLIVEPKLIRKKFLTENREHFLNVLNFITRYPYVTVLDTDGNNLLDVLVEKYCDIEAKKHQQPTIIKIETETVQETIEPKIQGEHLEVKEILAHLRKFQEYDIYSDEELDRLIRAVLSNQRKNGIQKKTLQRGDGVNVTCIDASQIDLVHKDLPNIVKEREKIMEEIAPVKTKETIKPQPTKREPIKIKKYITPDILKKIEKSSKQNVNLVLQAINEVNLDPLEMQFQGPVHIIKDGKETVSATVTLESGCCLVQSIDSSNYTDPKRVVWGVADGPDGLIIISIGYREHHNTKKASNLYADLRNQALKKQTYTQQELKNKGYIDVDILINDNNSDVLLPNTNILTQKLSDILIKKY
jgi:hypothetical protein